MGERDGWATVTGSTPAEKRQSTVQAFQGGQLKGLALTIQAGGVGLTLTRASNVLFVDLDWTPAMNIQAEDRVCRIGQNANGILIQRMVSDHPLDLHIQEILKYKIKLAYKALDSKIGYKVKPVVKKDEIAPELVEETEGEMMARIKEAATEAERQIAISKVQKIYDRGYDSWAEDVPEPKLTGDRKSMLRGALSYMCSVCDGAREKDGMGFNKPDSHIGHWLNATGLEENDEMSFRVLERLLCKYRRQLKEDFGQIWRP